MFSWADFHLVTDIIIALGLYSIIIAVGLMAFGFGREWKHRIMLRLELERRKRWQMGEDFRDAWADKEDGPPTRR